jgi:hypothetical protein
VTIQGFVKGVEVGLQAANQFLTRTGFQGVEAAGLQRTQRPPVVAPGTGKILGRPGVKRPRARRREGSVCERIGQEKGAGRGGHTYEGVDSGNESVTTALWKRYQQNACQSSDGLTGTGRLQPVYG